MNFDALDNQPVKLVMLFLVPQGQFQKHLHTLANIAKFLHKADFRQALEEAPDADAMLNIIKEYGKKSFIPEGRALRVPNFASSNVRGSCNPPLRELDYLKIPAKNCFMASQDRLSAFSL